MIGKKRKREVFMTEMINNNNLCKEITLPGYLNNNIKKSIKYIKFEDEKNEYKIREDFFKNNIKDGSLVFRTNIKKKTKSNKYMLSGNKIMKLYELMEIEDFREKYYKRIKRDLKEEKIKEFNNFVREKIDNNEWKELEKKSIFL